jgi:phosphoglucomutase
MCNDFPVIDVSNVGFTVIKSADGLSSVTVEVIDSTKDHVALLKTIFDFAAIKKLSRIIR